MINISKKTINHFRMRKFPTRYRGTDSNGVVLFLSQAEVIKHHTFLANFIATVFEWKFLGFRFVEDGTKIIIMCASDDEYYLPLHVSQRVLLEKIVQSQFQSRQLNAFLIDYNRVWIDSQIARAQFEDHVRHVLKTGEKVYLPPMKKETRTLISFWLSRYQHVKSCTVGKYSAKRIVLSYKK